MMQKKISELIFDIKKDLQAFTRGFITVEEAQQICERLEKNSREFKRRRDHFDPSHTALRDQLERFGF